MTVGERRGDDHAAFADADDRLGLRDQQVRLVVRAGIDVHGAAGADQIDAVRNCRKGVDAEGVRAESVADGLSLRAAGPRRIDVNGTRLHDLNAERGGAVAVGVEIIRLVRRDVVRRAASALRLVPGTDRDRAGAGVIRNRRESDSIRVNRSVCASNRALVPLAAPIGDQVAPPSVEYCQVPFELSATTTARPNCVAVLPSTSDGLR